MKPVMNTQWRDYNDNGSPVGLPLWVLRYGAYRRQAGDNAL
jgi:hypothetical protein